jgi:hypothetical protein
VVVVAMGLVGGRFTLQTLAQWAEGAPRAVGSLTPMVCDMW